MMSKYSMSTSISIMFYCAKLMDEDGLFVLRGSAVVQARFFVKVKSQLEGKKKVHR